MGIKIYKKKPFLDFTFLYENGNRILFFQNKKLDLTVSLKKKKTVLQDKHLNSRQQYTLKFQKLVAKLLFHVIALRISLLMFVLWYCCRSDFQNTNSPKFFCFCEQKITIEGKKKSR